MFLDKMNLREAVETIVNSTDIQVTLKESDALTTLIAFAKQHLEADGHCGHCAQKLVAGTDYDYCATCG